MKKVTMIFLLLMFFLKLPAPGSGCLMIVESEVVNKYDRLIKAIVKVESNNGIYVYNESEGAVGYFQIRKVRIDDYNAKTGSKYTLNDCYDYELSRKIFLYYTQERSFEAVAKSWNGSGPMTKVYWSKVKASL